MGMIEGLLKGISRHSKPQSYVPRDPAAILREEIQKSLEIWIPKEVKDLQGEIPCIWAMKVDYW